MDDSSTIETDLLNLMKEALFNSTTHYSIYCNPHWQTVHNNLRSSSPDDITVTSHIHQLHDIIHKSIMTIPEEGVEQSDRVTFDQLVAINKTIQDKSYPAIKTDYSQKKDKLEMTNNKIAELEKALENAKQKKLLLTQQLANLDQTKTLLGIISAMNKETAGTLIGNTRNKLNEIKTG